MPSDNGGTAASFGGETPLLHDGPICQDTTIVQLKSDLQLEMSKWRKKHLGAAAAEPTGTDITATTTK